MCQGGFFIDISYRQEKGPGFRAEWKAFARKPLKEKLKPYLFLLPMLLLAAGFVYYPFFKTFMYSFSTVNAKGEITAFVGLENFRYLFSRREFSAALTNTLHLAALNVPITVALTLFFAVLCARRRRISPVAETMFALPMAIAMSAIALIFKVLLNPTVGYVNHLFGLNFGWYRDKNTAFYGILLLTIWMGIGFNFLLFLSALRGVPDDVIGSACLDGAGPVTIFFRIQLPLITPTLLYVVCTNLVQALMTSGPIMVLTQGGPSRSTTTLIYMMYTSGYGSSNYSLAACISIVTFGLTLVGTILAFVAEGKKVHYD